MFAFRQNLHYHGSQAAKKVWTPAVGYFLTEREQSRHMHGIVYPVLYLFIIIYTSVYIKYTRAKQVEVTILRAEENTCASDSCCFVSRCKLDQALRFTSTAPRAKAK